MAEGAADDTTTTVCEGDIAKAQLNAKGMELRNQIMDLLEGNPPSIVIFVICELLTSLLDQIQADNDAQKRRLQTIN